MLLKKITYSYRLDGCKSRMMEARQHFRNPPMSRRACSQIMIYFRMYRDSANTNGTGDNFAGSAYVQFVDSHYLSTDGGTPLKVPPFYL